MVVLLLGLALLGLGARPAHAQGSSSPCFAGFGGVINGNVMPVPNNLGIDGRCTIENYQDAANSPNGVASPNGDYTGNITLLSTSDLLILSNVDFDGNVSCEVGSSHPTVFYLLNSEVDAHALYCMRKQGTVAQIDKIDKSIPSGQTTAAIGVPFTYALTFPQQCAPPTPTSSCPSVNPNGSTDVISQVTITDDLNASGVSLTYLSSVATWKGSTCPAPGAPVPFTGPAPNSTGLLTFSGFPTIPAACQVVVNVTVVLNNAVPPNSPGTTFVNTANWTLGTTLGGRFFFPLPGLPGVSPPLTIAAPTLVMRKGGPAAMNIGQLGRFVLDVQNTGQIDAWNATIVDKLPTGPTGGMCTAPPQILSAQVFEADGVTPVPGKGPLTAGTDYTVSYAGPPTCTLTLNLLSAAAAIGPTQRLIVAYQAQLDANSQAGAQLTNVAGAVQWFNAPSSTPSRQTFTCTLTNGTPGVLDCQDAHTVTVVAGALTIAKTVSVVGGGPAIPGATLSYLVHVTNTSPNPANPVVITDDLNAAGPGALTYVAGTATMNGSATGVTVSGNVITATYPGPLAPGGTIDLRFNATLGSALTPGTIVTNTGVVTWNNPPQNAFGSVSIQVATPTPPALTLTKGGPATLYIGQPGTFTLNVQNTGQSDAWNATIVDKLPTGATGGMCTATPQIISAQVFQADGVTPVPGKGPLAAGTDYTLSYAGSPTCTLTLNLLSAAAVIGPTQRLIVTYQTQLDPNSQVGTTLTNVAGATQWYNGPSSNPGRQSVTCALTNGTPGVLDCQDAHTVTVVAGALTITKTVAVVGGGPALPGATLSYLLHVTNTSANPANPVVITDDLNAAGPGALTYVAGTATMNGSATGVTVAGNVITATYPGPLAPGGTIDLRFNATLGATLAAGTTVTNTGVVTWNNPPQHASGSVSIQVAALTPPALTLTKGGPATLNVGQPARFTLNVQNTGTTDAWNATIVDKLPVGATGGMCTATPQIISAQVFESDGVTPVPGKGPLTAGTDYTLSYVGNPTCTLTLNLLSAAAVIGPSQRLIVVYQTQLDANSQVGVALTNVAGATQWYNGPSSNPSRQSFTCTLTNGTPGVLDCQDAHTVTVVAAALTITKTVSVVGGGPAIPGATLSYLVHVTNTSANPANPVVITDNLNTAGPGALTYVAGTATMNGSATGVTVAGNVITATYPGPLAPGATIDLAFRATLGATLAAGTTVTNTGTVTWNNPPQSASASVSIVVVAVTPPALTLTKAGPATLYRGQLGTFTLNVQNTGTTDAWNATIVDKLPTGATGGMCTAAPQILSAQVFQADGVTPVPGKGPLVPATDYTFTYAGAPTCTLTLNLLSAAAVIGPTQRLIVVYQTQLDANSQPGATLTNVAGATQWYNGPSSNLGRQSFNCTLTNGTPGVLDCQDAHTVTVVASALTITKTVSVVGGGMPVPGATLSYLLHVTNTSANAASPVVITDDLNAAGPGALTYVAGTATMNGSATGVTVTGNVITATYPGPLAPGTTIDLAFRATLGNTLAVGTVVTNTGTATWNNPPQSVSASVSIQVDTPPGALTVSKTTPLVDVTRGQLVPYTLTVTNVLTGPVQGAALVDRFPAGFRYVKGSARIDGTPAEPVVAGLTLTWSNLNFVGGGHHTVVLLLVVGAGVGEGEFVNRAQAYAAVGGPAVSAEAKAMVRVVPDATFDCTDVIGKVFDDKNGNGQQDPGEPGIPGVRVVTTRGLAAVTDEFGRFHITCAITPLEGRGSNFTLKLDDRTLPSGYRLTTPQVLVERATRGKALRFDFGASIHRVVSLDLSDAVFEPGTADMRPQWRPRLDLLLAELRKSQSVLRLAYVADVEDAALVDRRLEVVGKTIRDSWHALNCCYELTIEREIFWLRGGPPKEPVERLRGAK